MFKTATLNEVTESWSMRALRAQNSSCANAGQSRLLPTTTVSISFVGEREAKQKALYIRHSLESGARQP